MKRLYIFIWSVFIYSTSNAQSYDAQWLVGCDPPGVLSFETDTVGTDSLVGGMWNFLTNANICDENGNLLYCTNGIFIGDKNGEPLLNGDSINPCPYTNEWAFSGLNIRQAALFLPEPDSSRYYYLIHFSNDNLNEVRPETLYYSLIDKEGNSGLGAVKKKNIFFFHGEILREGGMTACKHANGRDYWIIIGASVVNKFYKFLLTPEGLLGPYSQNIGPTYPLPFDNAYSKFSQDGTKYATGAIEGLVLVMDFDRCTGEFSNPVTIFNNASNDPDTMISGCVSLEFSPNGRFLYVSDNNDLNQYDLWSDNIQDSAEVYKEDSTDYAGIDMVQVAPNGKLYGSTWDGGFYFVHVVNFPDLKGDSCGFVWGGQPNFAGNSNNLPNMINYNLGPTNIYQAGAGNDTSVCSQDTTGVWIGLPALAGVVYSWQPAPGITDTTLPQQLVKPSQSSWYYVTFTDTSIQYSCPSREDSVYVEVKDCVNGIQRVEASSNSLNIYSNPADKYMYVEMGMPGNYEFLLLNESGQLIAQKETRQADIFDTEGLAAGVYFIKAVNKNSNSEIGVKKIVVAH